MYLLTVILGRYKPVCLLQQSSGGRAFVHIELTFFLCMCCCLCLWSLLLWLSEPRENCLMVAQENNPLVQVPCKHLRRYVLDLTHMCVHCLEQVSDASGSDKGHADV